MIDYIFYHKQDLDGWASAAIYVKYAKENNKKYQLVPINYNEKYPDYNWNLSNKIYFLDFSPTIQFAEKYYDKIVLIDHHISAIKKLSKFIDSNLIEYKISNSYPSGCELTWEYFYKNNTPESIKYISNYDSWNDPEGDNFLFYLAANSYEETRNPESNIWIDLFNDSITDNFINEGKIIIRNNNTVNKDYCNLYSYETEFESYKAIVLNYPLGGSKVFNSIYNPDIHDIMIMWNCSTNGIKVSLYTTKDDIDVSKIAEKYGGGGHKKAAGFVLKDYDKTLSFIL